MAFKFDKGIMYQFLCATQAMITVISPGMTIAWSAVALPLLRNDTSQENDAILYNNSTAASWFASIISLSCPIGSYLNTILMRTGRKIPLAVVGYTCTAGWIILATSNSIEQLIIGRFIAGIGTGLVSAPTAVYVAEIASAKYRLCLLNLSNVAMSCGFLSIYILGYLTSNWRTQAAIASVVPLVSATSLLICLPESPVWLLHKNQEAKAILILLKLRGVKEETAEFIQELNQMVLSVKDHVNTSITNDSSNTDKITSPSKNVGKIRNLVNAVRLPEVWKPFLILNTLFFFQNFTGIYVIVAYTVDFLTNCGVSLDPFLITMTMGVVQLLSCITVVFTSHKVGVRKACLMSATGMALAFGTLVAYLIFLKPSDSHRKYQAIPIACLFFYAATGFYGLKSMPWSIVGELYPTIYTHYLTPLTTCNASIFSFVAVYIYPLLVANGFTMTVSVYFIMSILAMIFIATALPETRGVPRHEITAKFQKK